MSELLALGASHKTAPLAVRERLALLDGQVEHRDGQRLLVCHADAAALNTRLVGAGLRVRSIGAQQRTLEDIVLSVTGTGSDQIS